MSERPRSNRRQFLTARALRDEVAQRAENLVQAIDAELPQSEHTTADPAAAQRDRPTYLLEVSRRAMACEFAVQLNASSSASETELAMGTLDLLEPLEQQMSVYRPDSEVSVLNRLAATRSVPLTGRLFRLLRLAESLSESTSGAFDITTGPLLRAWGFHQRLGAVPSDQQLAAARQAVGWQLVELNETGQSVRFDRAGMEINLGGIGKGYALDVCAQHLLEGGVENFLLHGGQSSIVAHGDRRRGGSGRGWEVSVRHPLRPDRSIATIVLCDQAMSTSGCGTQHFYHQGQRYSHLLDPRSGRPASSGLLSATAVTPEAARADALSTAFYVLGEAGTQAYCQQHPDVSALLMLPGTRTGEVRLVSFGFQESEPAA